MGAPPPRLGYVPALDGLRGVAVAAVVAYHAFGNPRGGWIGVELFFVLSGFLITTLLLEAETIDFRRFYARRARRLLPALAVLLVAYLALGGTPSAVARFGFYGGNVYAAFWPGASLHLVGLNHLWSLAQEEQFYLVWPAALLLVRKAQHPARLLVALAAALMLYRIGLAAHGASNARIYFAPDTNVDGLLLGAALAFRRVAPSRWSIGLAVGVFAFVGGLVASEAWLDAIFLPFVEVASVVFIAAAVAGTLRLPRALVWLGGISYSLYLWHFVVLWAFHQHHALLAVAVSVAVAAASTAWIERPLLQHRRDARSRRRSSATPRHGRAGRAALAPHGGEGVLRREASVQPGLAADAG